MHQCWKDLGIFDIEDQHCDDQVISILETDKLSKGDILKLVCAIFYQIFISHEMIALQKTIIILFYFI